jgi:hypothetical protein
MEPTRWSTTSSPLGWFPRGQVRWRDVLDAGGQRPLVAERIADAPGALAVELVGEGVDDLGAGANGTIPRGVDVGPVGSRTWLTRSLAAASSLSTSPPAAEAAVRAYRLMWNFTLGSLLVHAGENAEAPSPQRELRGTPDPERYQC